MTSCPGPARSLGLLMWELIEGETPFHDVANLDGMLPLFWQVRGESNHLSR